MEIRDLKIYIYESCDCGLIDDNVCKRMINACESVTNDVGNGIISTLQASIESLKELILYPKDYVIKKDIVINKDKETEIYCCVNLLKDCIGSRNIDNISSQMVLKLMSEYKNSDHHTWKDNVHDKIHDKIIPKLDEELDKRRKKYEEIMEDYSNDIDKTSISYKDFPHEYTSFCNEDIKFYNEYIKEAIEHLEDCKEILKKMNSYNLPSYTGILQTYVTSVVKLNMRTVQNCHSIMKKTLDYNKNKYESL